MILLLAAAVFADTDPRKSPEEYPVREKLERATLAAEYLVRTVSASGQSFMAGDFLVVEVAIYVTGGEPVMVKTENFRLRINDGKQELQTVPARFVALALKYSDWYGSGGRPYNAQDKPGLTDEEAINQSALASGPVERARAGCVYFEFKGKTKSIKKLELIYSGEAGQAALSLK